MTIDIVTNISYGMTVFVIFFALVDLSSHFEFLHKHLLSNGACNDNEVHADFFLDSYGFAVGIEFALVITQTGLDLFALVRASTTEILTFTEKVALINLNYWLASPCHLQIGFAGFSVSCTNWLCWFITIVRNIVRTETR